MIVHSNSYKVYHMNAKFYATVKYINIYHFCRKCTYVFFSGFITHTVVIPCKLWNIAWIFASYWLHIQVNIQTLNAKIWNKHFQVNCRWTLLLMPSLNFRYRHKKGNTVAYWIYIKTGLHCVHLWWADTNVQWTLSVNCTYNCTLDIYPTLIRMIPTNCSCTFDFY